MGESGMIPSLLAALMALADELVDDTIYVSEKAFTQIEQMMETMPGVVDMTADVPKGGPTYTLSVTGESGAKLWIRRVQ